VTPSEAADAERLSARRWMGVAAALAVIVSALACAPGLLGTWVYDDRTMLDNPLYDEVSDALQVFSYNSADYIGRGELNRDATTTYRPVTMFTLVATHALAPKPWVHHAVGWLLHLLTAGLLYLGLATRPRSLRIDGVAAWLGAVFLFHPIGVEAYVWINGRSDLVAGLFLALLVLLRPGRAPVSVATAALWLAIGFLGTAAKLPFAVAALFLWLGAWLRLEPERRGRSDLALPVALSCGIAPFVALRMLYSPLVEYVSAGAGFDAISLWAPAPKFAAESAYALLSFGATSMQSMAWNAVRPWTAAETVGAAAVLLSTGGLLWRRDWGGLAYAAGALLTIAPTLFVAQSIWFGFDRYLYMPLILVLLAVEPYLRELGARLRSRRRFIALAGASVLLIAIVDTHLASRAYASHLDLLDAMLTERPNDPTVRLYVVGTLLQKGDKQNAAEQFGHMPGPPWPKATIVQQARIARDLEATEMLAATIEYGRSTYPDDPWITFHSMHWDYRNERFDDLLASARRFPVEDSACTFVRQQLLQWAGSAEGDARTRLHAAANAMHCVARAR
jgi:hypothetical protein